VKFACEFLGESFRELWLRLADTGLLGYRHLLERADCCYSNLTLATESALSVLARDVQLVSHAYRNSPIDHYPCIETWTLVDGASRGQAAPYRRIQYHTIRKHLNKVQRHLQGSYAVFPHFTSHFGHWVGDQLGAFLWFSRQLQTLPDPPRLLGIAPSEDWADFLIEHCPKGSLLLLTPQEYLDANWVLDYALVLPRLSPWQNLLLLRDCLAPSFLEVDSIFLSGPPDDRIFLCSNRSERILNLDAVEKVFRRFEYEVLNPVLLSPSQLMHRIRHATSLWCEHGSMVMNALIARQQPYRVLELDSHSASCYPPDLLLLGGGIYNSFHSGLIQPFQCQPSTPSTLLDLKLHPYQRQLVVDLEALERELMIEVQGS